MHAFIFWGFLVLFPTIVEAMLAIVDPDWTLPILGHAAWFAFLADLFATMVAIGVCIAFYIRKIQKPDRFRGSHMREADRILLTILSIVATLLLWNATQIALGTFPHPSAAPVANALSNLFSTGQPTETLERVFVSACPDRARLPDLPPQVQASAHHHGRPKRLLREERPRRLPRPRAHRSGGRRGGPSLRCGDGQGPVEEAAARSVQLHRMRPVPGGVPRLGHRQAAVAEAADHGPPRSCRGHRPGRDGGGHDRAAAARAERRRRRGCVGLRHLWRVRTRVSGGHRARRRIVALRRNLVMAESRFPTEAGTMLRGIEGPHENPWGQPAASRTEWVGDIPVRVLQPGEQAPEYLFWVGCAGAFDDRAKQTTQSVARLLNAAGIDWAVLGPRDCTGDPARRMGHEYLFQMLAEQNVATFSEARVRSSRDVRAPLQRAGQRVPRLRGLVRGRAPHRAAVTLIADGVCSPPRAPRAP